jgi:hypothetical protein
LDSQRFKDAYEKLQLLDDRLTYKVRPRSTGLSRATPEQLEAGMRDLATYTVELKEVVQELFLAISGRPSKPE